MNKTEHITWLQTIAHDLNILEHEYGIAGTATNDHIIRAQVNINLAINILKQQKTNG